MTNKKRFGFLLSLITIAGVSFGIEASAAVGNDLSEVCQKRVGKKFRSKASGKKVEGQKVKVKEGSKVNFHKINTADQEHRTLYLAHADLEVVGAPDKKMTAIMYYRGQEIDWNLWSECHFDYQTGVTVIESSSAANERIDRILAISAQADPEVRDGKVEAALLKVITVCTRSLRNSKNGEASVEGSDDVLSECTTYVQAGLAKGISTEKIYTSILEGTLDSKEDQ